MSLRQYVYFALVSERMSAAEMTAILGIEPDEIAVRGSRRAEPVMLPASHRWKVVCREPGLRVDEQISRLLDRLGPQADRIAELARRLDAEDGVDGSAVLEIVRYFGDEEAESDGQSDTGGIRPHESADKPNLFGWHLDRNVLAFLAATGAVLDVDEYDMTPGAEPDELKLDL